MLNHDCSGCPQCDPEMAQLLRDAMHRPAAYATKLRALTHRTLGALRMTAHPATEAVAPPPSLVPSLQKIRNAPPSEAARKQAIADFMRPAPVGAAPTSLPRGSNVPSPACPCKK